jgi:transposase
MSIVGGTLDGEKRPVAEKRRRLTDEELRQLRATQMQVYRLKGLTVREIAACFNLTRQHAYRILNAIPPRLKARIRREYELGKFDLVELGG